MKKQSEKQSKTGAPVFTTEAGEAEWWYKNRCIHGQQLVTAVKNGPSSGADESQTVAADSVTVRPFNHRFPKKKVSER